MPQTLVSEADAKRINQLLHDRGVSLLRVSTAKTKADLKKSISRLRNRIRNIRQRMELDTDHRIRAERQQKINAIYEALEMLGA